MILIGSEEKIKNMVDNNRRTRRYTCLKRMLCREEKDSQNSLFEMK
jgi:exodeoxyribonuclease V alpha subunit